MNENKHISIRDVITGHFNGGGFAFYRLPDAEYYTFVSQQGRPTELAALDVSDSFTGVVIAPFVASEDTPVVLLSHDNIEKQPFTALPSPADEMSSFTNDDSKRYQQYLKSFEACHQSLIEGKTSKIVLSRRMALTNTSSTAWNEVNLFLAACRKYPHNYVSLWWTERTGSWLVATPETLLKRTQGEQWQTMALAGTMKWDEYSKKGLEEAWSTKNREEQLFVSTYIEQRLLPFVKEMTTSPTYTSQAADLAHLRTDFTFKLKEGVHLGKLLQQLHPTPAVCGVPQDAAQKVILQNEDSSRRYYAGFSGPVNIEGNSQLYVSLRCMEISPDKALLYAGGGLLKESHVEEEWLETQRKMQTMLHLF